MQNKKSSFLLKYISETEVDWKRFCLLTSTLLAFLYSMDILSYDLLLYFLQKALSSDYFGLNVRDNFYIFLFIKIIPRISFH